MPPRSPSLNLYARGAERRVAATARPLRVGWGLRPAPRDCCPSIRLRVPWVRSCYPMVMRGYPSTGERAKDVETKRRGGESVTPAANNI